MHLAKKPLKEALKVLQTYEAFASDFVTATVIQQALGGHAIPIDKNTHRALERLGIGESTVPELRAVLERAVPKNRGIEFLDLLEDLANDTCVEGEPDCPRCELRKICPFVQARKQDPSTPDASEASRPVKPRPPKEKDAAKTHQGESGRGGIDGRQPEPGQEGHAGKPRQGSSFAAPNPPAAKHDTK